MFSSSNGLTLRCIYSLLYVILAAEAEEVEEVEKIPPPPGVTFRDVELFKKVQQTTAEVSIDLYGFNPDFCLITNTRSVLFCRNDRL